MRKKLFILVIALAVVFTMSAVPGFAASKQVVEKSSKTYDVRDDGSLEMTRSTVRTFNPNGTVKTVKYTDRWFGTVYDEGGNPEEKWTKSTTESKYTYKNGKVKQLITKDDGKISNKQVYTYKNGKVKSVTLYSYDNGKYTKANVTTYKRTSKKVTEITKDMDGNETYKAIDTLDSKGRTKKSVIYYDGKKEGTYKTTYWKNGNMRKTEYNSIDGLYSNYTKYNKKGLVTEIYYRSGSSEGYQIEDKTEYTYDSNGLLKKAVVTDSETNNGETTVDHYTLTYKYSNWYGSTKKYPKTVWIRKDGKKIQKEVRSYAKI